MANSVRPPAPTLPCDAVQPMSAGSAPGTAPTSVDGGRAQLHRRVNDQVDEERREGEHCRQQVGARGQQQQAGNRQSEPEDARIGRATRGRPAAVEAAFAASTRRCRARRADSAPPRRPPPAPSPPPPAPSAPGRSMVVRRGNTPPRWSPRPAGSAAAWRAGRSPPPGCRNGVRSPAGPRRRPSRARLATFRTAERAEAAEANAVRRCA